MTVVDNGRISVQLLSLETLMESGKHLYIFLRTRRCGEHLDPRRRKWQGAEEECMMGSFVTCRIHEVLLLGRLSQGGW